MKRSTKFLLMLAPVEDAIAPPAAEFSADNTSPSGPGDIITFTDESSGDIDSWSWEAKDPADVTWTEFSTLQNPSVTAGDLQSIAPIALGISIRLTVTGPGGSDSEEKVGYIVPS